MDADNFLVISLKSVKFALFIHESILQSPPQLHYQKKFHRFPTKKWGLFGKDFLLKLGFCDSNQESEVTIYPPPPRRRILSK